MSGRSSWWSKDVAWHRRELNVELGEEFGASGPMVIDVLSAWAKEQSGPGRKLGVVRGGFRTLAREAFVTVCHAGEIVSRAAQIGALDDLVLDEDGRRFTCRVSGFAADQQMGRAAERKAHQRHRDAESDPDGSDDEPDATSAAGVTERDLSRSVPRTDLHHTTDVTEGEGRASEPAAVHPDLGEVVGIFAGAGVPTVDDGSLNNALLSLQRRGFDGIDLAHMAASWVRTGESRPPSSLLNAAADVRDRKLLEAEGIRDAKVARVTVHDSQVADLASARRRSVDALERAARGDTL